jgi:hypothetical protein
MSKHAQRITTEAELPPHIAEALKELPAYVDRRTGAALITQYLFPVSHRTLEAWDLPTRLVNNKAVTETRGLLEIAYAKFFAAPLIMGGRGGREKTG